MTDNSDKTPLNSFEQLETWQKSQDLAVKVYKLTDSFPTNEQFGLTNQIRRAVTSVSANIAEGFGRRSEKEKLNFYSIARGSLLEVKNFNYLSKRFDFIDESTFEKLIEQIVVSQKLINGLIKSTKHRNVTE